MVDASSSEDSQQSSTDLSRRRVVAGAVTLSVAGALSPAFAQPTDRSPDMPDNIRFSNPDTMQKPPGYSHVVEVTGPGRTVYFAGQLGIDKSGKMGANAREQVEIAFENVKAALASVGANFDHVVKQLYRRHRHQHRALPRGARQVREQGGASGQYHGRSATTRTPRRAVRGRGNRRLAAEVTAPLPHAEGESRSRRARPRWTLTCQARR